MSQINVGVIGLGRIGRVHLENLVYRMPQVKVMAASDIDTASHSFAKNLNIPNIYHDHEAILDDPAIQAVVICSPTSTHLKYCKAAAEKGKHIFCEKPLEITIEKIREIRDFVHGCNVKLQVGFNRRFDKNFAKVHAMVAAGEIGQPHILKITSRDPGPPPLEYLKGSGGKFMDMTIHDFDMSRFIVGAEVEEIYARGENRVDPQIGVIGDIDTSIILLKFSDGTLGTIDNSRKAVYGYDQRLEIFGSKGMTKINNVLEDDLEHFGEIGGRKPKLLHFFMERYTDSYFNELNAFIRAILTNKPVPVDAHDALMATAIALGAKLSMRENRPVRLDEIL